VTVDMLLNMASLPISSFKNIKGIVRLLPHFVKIYLLQKQSNSLRLFTNSCIHAIRLSLLHLSMNAVVM
jgi:hypothetical protein